MSRLLYLQDNCRSNDGFSINNPRRINSKIDFFDAETGERIWEPLHNKTVIAGAGFTLQKLFNLDKSCLNSTPTYNDILALEDNDTSSAPIDETERSIIGFCVGSGGAGLEVSDVFEVPYASWITPDNLIPFMYPLQSSDSVDINIYKGKKVVQLGNEEIRNAYYFKTFSNTPSLVQNYVSTIGTGDNTISADTVYNYNSFADKAQSYVELHLEISKNDCREFYNTNVGLELARVNQLSLVYGWKSIIDGIETFQQVRPFSICNFPTEILSDREKTISIIYTLYC